MKSNLVMALGLILSLSACSVEPKTKVVYRDRPDTEKTKTDGGDKTVVGIKPADCIPSSVEGLWKSRLDKFLVTLNGCTQVTIDDMGEGTRYVLDFGGKSNQKIPELYLARSKKEIDDTIDELQRNQSHLPAWIYNWIISDLHGKAYKESDKKFYIRSAKFTDGTSVKESAVRHNLSTKVEGVAGMDIPLMGKVDVNAEGVVSMKIQGTKMVVTIDSAKILSIRSNEYDEFTNKVFASIGKVSSNNAIPFLLKRARYELNKVQ